MKANLALPCSAGLPHFAHRSSNEFMLHLPTGRANSHHHGKRMVDSMLWLQLLPEMLKLINGRR